jgi:hypothetical protein
MENFGSLTPMNKQAKTTLIRKPGRSLHGAEEAVNARFI